MRIQHNIMAMSAYRNYTNNVSAMKKNLEKLSSGYKINRAGDDAAGLAISEKMRAQITGLETAQKNAKDGISLVQTAEGALTEVHDMLNRMVELATQSANGTYDDKVDRKQMQKEINQLREEIDRIADSSNFNGIKLLDGSMGLNDKAITDIKYLAADTVTTSTTLASAAKVASTAVHGQKADSFQKPSVTINLGDVKIKNNGSATATVAVTISVGSIKMTVSITGVGSGATVGAATIASAIRNKYTAASASAGASAGGWVNIGGAAYKATGSGNIITLELFGVQATAASAPATVTATTNTEAFTSSMASAFTTAIDPGATVKVSASGGSDVVLKNEDSYIHGVTGYSAAKAEGDSHRWGADVALGTSLMKDGNKLTIGVGTAASQAKTFTISISSTATKSTVTASGTVKISTKDAGTTASAQLKKFVEIMENQDAGYFKISGKDPNTIHIDVRSSVAASKVATWTKDTIVSAVSVKSFKDEKLKGVEFNLATSGLATGDVINIGDKKFAFASSATGAYSASKGGSFKDAATLKKALEAAGYNVVENSGNFKVYASNASANAPSVLGKGLTLQIGDTADDFNQLNVQLKDMHVDALGIGSSTMNIQNQTDAAKAVDMIKDAINQVSDLRGTLGATQNRLDHTINNLSVMTENIQDAESTIRDVDVAEEMMAYTKNNILIQSAQAMLAQANQVPQGVLQLLG